MTFSKPCRLTRSSLRWAHGCMGMWLLLVGGCTSSSTDDFSRVPVEGTILVDGQPLESGVLCFVPLDNVIGPKTSVTIEAGHFVATQQTGPAPGKHRIEIRRETNNLPAFDDEQTLVQLNQQRTKKLGKLNQLPLKYNDQSDLVAVIEVQTDGKPQTLNYQLQSR